MQLLYVLSVLSCSVIVHIPGLDVCTRDICFDSGWQIRYHIFHTRFLQIKVSHTDNRFIHAQHTAVTNVFRQCKIHYFHGEITVDIFLISFLNGISGISQYMKGNPYFFYCAVLVSYDFYTV